MHSLPLMAHAFPAPPVISGIGITCGLGVNANECHHALAASRSALRTLDQYSPPPPGNGLAAWIAPGAIPQKRRCYATATQLALRVAAEAMEHAAWSTGERHGAWIFAGSSRGNAGELTGMRRHRRAMRKFAASNSLHSEIAAACGIDLGIRGPWQVFSNGCAAGLDALGWAALAVASGWTTRALVVAVDLPLAPALLDDFRNTGLLGNSGRNDPYSPDTDGFHPGEAAAAVTLEAASSSAHRSPLARVGSYLCGSDAHHAVGLPANGAPLAACLARAVELCGGPHSIAAICPHATGTAEHRRSESASLAAVFPEAGPSLHLLKPFSGHSLGASGLLDTALLCGWLRQNTLPPNLPGLTPPSPRWNMPETPRAIPPDEWLLKISAGMGGHNAVVALSPP